jgi:hypothetical protein
LNAASRPALMLSYKYEALWPILVGQDGILRADWQSAQTCEG